jgi:hypothetical protein
MSVLALARRQPSKPLGAFASPAGYATRLRSSRLLHGATLGI